MINVINVKQMLKKNEDKDKVTPVVTTLTLLFTALLPPLSKVSPMIIGMMMNCGQNTCKMVTKLLVQHQNPDAVHSVRSVSSVCLISLSKLECCCII